MFGAIMKLYNYWRSSTSYRVRIALAIKGLAYDYVPVNLLKGEQNAAEYLRLNPSGGVPTLVDGDLVIAQSLAIIDYLDRAYPQHPFLPDDARARARVLQIAHIVATDMHQFANLPVLNYIGERLGDDEKPKWVAHWFAPALDAMEQILAAGPRGDFCHGDSPTLADICLIPQLFAARRFNVDLNPYPNIVRIDANCAAHLAFAMAHPSKQPDAVL